MRKVIKDSFSWILKFKKIKSVLFFWVNFMISIRGKLSVLQCNTWFFQYGWEPVLIQRNLIILKTFVVLHADNFSSCCQQKCVQKICLGEICHGSLVLLWNSPSIFFYMRYTIVVLFITYTSTQGFVITFSYLLTQQLLGLVLNFDWLAY